MHHSFDIEIAAEHGIEAAVILNHLYYWIEHNKANDVNKFDGRYWTFNSVKAFAELFPYLSKGRIVRTLNKLEESGLIVSGNYNKSAYDRTKWYALTDMGYSTVTHGDKYIEHEEQFHLSELVNGINADGKAIPDINTDVKPDNDISVEFDEIWNEYPRKAGKKSAFDAYKKSRKDGATKEDVLNGVKAYARHIRSSKTEWRFIKQGSTFFRGENWRDEYGSTGFKVSSYEEAPF